MFGQRDSMKRIKRSIRIMPERYRKHINIKLIIEEYNKERLENLRDRLEGI